MPIFEYAAASEENRNPCCSFEYLHRGHEEALQSCPWCGSPVQRVPSRFGMGSGSAGRSSTSTRTADALRSAGLSDYADSWKEVSRALSTDTSRHSRHDAEHQRKGEEEIKTPSAASRTVRLAQEKGCAAGCSGHNHSHSHSHKDKKEKAAR